MASSTASVSGDASSDHGSLNLEIEVKHKGDPVKVKPSESEPEREDKEPFYFLCNLDQNIAVIMKTIYFYKSPSRGNEDAVDVVRDSLSKVLSHYYPLAGRLGISQEGKLIVECTDEGVSLAEAEASCGIMDVLSRLDQPDTLLKLVYDVEGPNILAIPLMTAQVTKFKCGGFTVGIAMNHCMADGISAVEFLSSWGQTARNLPLKTPPFLDRSILKSGTPPTPKFPHHEFLQLEDTSGTESLYESDPMEYKSFVFDEDRISTLKSEALEDGGGGGRSVVKCTTFELLTAAVWRARTKVLGMKADQQVKLLFAVDGRPKFSPHLPSGFFGNGMVLTYSLCTAGELVDSPLSEAVKLVQEAIKRINEEYIRSAIDHFELTRARPSLTGTLLITTWSRLAFHAMDFGWGEAIYAGPVGLPGREVAVFLPLGVDRKGVIVHLGLPRSAMEAFQELVMREM